MREIWRIEKPPSLKCLRQAFLLSVSSAWNSVVLLQPLQPQMSSRAALSSESHLRPPFSSKKTSSTPLEMIPDWLTINRRVQEYKQDKTLRQTRRADTKSGLQKLLMSEANDFRGEV